MDTSTLVVVLLALTAVAFYLARQRSLAVASQSGGLNSLHSRPAYYGSYAAALAAVPALILLVIWQSLEPTLVSSLVMAQVPSEIIKQIGSESLAFSQVVNIARGITPSEDAAMLSAAEHYQSLNATGNTLRVVAILSVTLLGLAYGWRAVRPKLKARNHVEKMLQIFLLFCSTLAILTTAGIVLSVLFEAVRFFQIIPVTDFIFGLEWSPQIALRADQEGASGAFGAIPLFTGTLMISFIAMCIAAPVGLMSAIYLAEYADARVRNIVKPVLEILAGIPTVVYGFFAALTAAPFIRDIAHGIGISSASSESALAAGVVMGVMIIPFVSSLSDDVITAVPQSLRDGSLGLGATKSETIRHVVVPAALPGVVGGLLLAVSRAIGETMIVVMAAGLSANLTANPLDSVTTVTVQIVTLLVGDQEFDSPKTLAAFALGLTLFVVTLALNFVALRIVKKYREQYD
ncbi:Phosphate transport system permease ABC transporter protein [Vibrio nigripulchritudo SO65]|uniref:phosphate ABC transporter permease subunit PstC n=1 Tax=Vibrio nigripulchritudo TaxID=28173 RepID=UPI0003B18B8D|nr:phosphate ABC transporter permease subunit PstC [Vibrio nigripulchritudo]CCN33653.1 Phosphate transport system permease ABC transporter protein [Vibrio nigripulchritudo AM115]CCN42021.1 Phosphate transport system permease ABC transporter protein [Vibrio nigripulchritudo FTn2]CCN67087.1 Phosphate transport system permease ABC transporter protein [Vibrio nigripulchritudo POn4]CCN78796.1 Phosphate transport system permease ABC transporter protein [Vibrio nigripulchritudo SO65]